MYAQPETGAPPVSSLSWNARRRNPDERRPTVDSGRRSRQSRLDAGNPRKPTEMEWTVKRMMMALMAFVAATAFTAGFAGAAQAAPEAAAVCAAVADENRAVWAGPGTAGGTVGSVVAGRSYDADCALVPGESSTACGGTTSDWAYVNYAGDDWGYVPSTCVTWAS
jgi:hypothetical protein